jgi:hypothetical protein
LQLSTRAGGAGPVLRWVLRNAEADGWELGSAALTGVSGTCTLVVSALAAFVSGTPGDGSAAVTGLAVGAAAAAAVVAAGAGF